MAQPTQQQREAGEALARGEAGLVRLAGKAFGGGDVPRRRPGLACRADPLQLAAVFGFSPPHRAALRRGRKRHRFPPAVGRADDRHDALIRAGRFQAPLNHDPGTIRTGIREASLVRLKTGADSVNLIIKLRQWESTLTRYGDLRHFRPESSAPQPAPADPGAWQGMDEWHGQQVAIYRRYREMMREVEEYLRVTLDDDALVRQLFTDRYWHMINNSPAGEHYQPAVGTIEFERICRDQAGHLRRFRGQLEALAASARGTGTVVVPDTNIFAHCGTVRVIEAGRPRCRG